MIVANRHRHTVQSVGDCRFSESVTSGSYYGAFGFKCQNMTVTCRNRNYALNAGRT